MRAFTLTHVSDRDLLRDSVALAAQESATTATLLAHIAEIDARKLYLPAGFPSMFAYCIQELHLSEDSAYKRIRAGRTARQFPALFNALEEGRIHLSGMILLAAHLTPESSEELIGAAAHKTKAEIELLLAQRFPRTELLPMVHALPAPVSNAQFSSERVEPQTSKFDTGQQAPGPVRTPAPRPKMTPVAPKRFALQFMIDESTHDDLEYARALLSHQVPSGDLEHIFGRALKALIGQTEKRKFAATNQPRTAKHRSSTNPRYIPAYVKRAVWERDQGRCAFVGENGHRCEARKFLEYDHMDAVARGGVATVENVRLRCRAHNQHEAECTFGAGFMDDRREAARKAASEARVRAEAAEQAAAEEARAASDRDVLGALRTLGYRADEARRAVAFSASLADAPLEQRVRLALSYVRPKARPPSQRWRARGGAHDGLERVTWGGLKLRCLEEPAELKAGTAEPVDP